MTDPSSLVALARSLESRSLVPYSGLAVASVVLLSDGSWVPGVRLESASFSLSIPAVLNGITTAVALGRTDIVAVAQNVPFSPQDETYLLQIPFVKLSRRTDSVLTVGVNTPPVASESPLSPFMDGAAQDGIELVRQVAARAFVPESQFPVGCTIVLADRRIIPGVNVEHPDWGHIVCAERNALGTAASYGLAEFAALYVTCLKDAAGTPCGACRQLIAERAPYVKIILDRHTCPPEETHPGDLLPGFFTGQAITSAIG